jgi:hypothetical protein
MIHRTLMALAAVSLLSVSPALAQSPTPSANAPQTARGMPNETVPNAETAKRERQDRELDRREIFTLAAVARMA